MRQIFFQSIGVGSLFVEKAMSLKARHNQISPSPVYYNGVSVCAVTQGTFTGHKADSEQAPQPILCGNFQDKTGI